MIYPEELGSQRTDLAAALRRLREESRLSGGRLAVRAAMSQSKISKIENGRIVPTVLDVDRILKALDVPQDLANELLALARLANTEFYDVRSSLRRGLHHRQHDLAALETSAGQLRYFLPVMITGLLHTAEYAKASLGRAVGEQSLTIAKRLTRQAVLHDKTKSFRFLLTEAAIRWALCPPSMMATQVDRIVSVSRLPNVDVSVIAMATEVSDAPLNTFTVYDERLVTAETIGGLVVMGDPRDVTLHVEMFAFFQRHAVSGDHARDILCAVADEFRLRARP